MRLLKAFLLFMIFSLAIEMNNVYCGVKNIYTLEDLSNLPLCLVQSFLGPLSGRKPSDVESLLKFWAVGTNKSLSDIEHPDSCIEFIITKRDDKKNELSLTCKFELGKHHCMCCSKDAWEDVGRMNLRVKYPSSSYEGIRIVDGASADMISRQEGRTDGVVIVYLVGKVVSVDESTWNKYAHLYHRPESELTSTFVERELAREKESGAELKPLMALDINSPGELSNNRAARFCDTVSGRQDFTSKHTEESLRFSKPKGKKKESTLQRKRAKKI